MKPRCELIGTDGNVFAIIANVSRCLKNADMKKEAAEFEERAFTSESYAAVLRLCTDYVEVA